MYICLLLIYSSQAAAEYKSANLLASPACADADPATHVCGLICVSSNRGSIMKANNSSLLFHFSRCV